MCVYAMYETITFSDITNLQGASQISALILHFITAFFIIAAVYEVSFLIRQFPLLENWAAQGVAELYLAVLVLSTAYPGRYRSTSDMTIRVCTYVLFGMGVVSVLIGALDKQDFKKRKEARLKAARNEEHQNYGAV